MPAWRANCPACGAELRFSSGVSVCAVCEFCRSTVVRTDQNLELIGKVAALTEDWSPLQLGTEGRFERVAFCLRGRLQRRWERGSWNEWFALFDDGRHGWVSEAQGQYCVSFPVDPLPALPKREEAAPGITITVGKEQFEISDVKDAVLSYAEGELPIPAVVGRASLNVDLRSLSGAFACIEYSSDAVMLYSGRYLPFDQLAFSNLRQLDGW